jgi:UDP-N-acetylglucosamine 1-carboxyvinyltransferase
MGARVTGGGTSTIRVEAPAKLGGASHTLRGDYIEAASWAVVGAVTKGDVEITGVHAEDLEPITAVLAEMQLDFDLEDQRLAVRPSTLVGMRRLTTGLWPGFPSDIVSLVTVMATQAQGGTLVHDWLYELRLFALEQLSAMRADLFLCDPHRIIVTGPTRLRGRTLDSRDIRSGMALVAAALAAEGQSTVLEIETVERGYEDLVDRLTALGADVMRRESPR